MVHRDMASLQYVSGCASSGHWVWRRLDHSSDRCTSRAFLASALFCCSPLLPAQGLTENIVQKSWVNWGISGVETSLPQTREGECVPGVPGVLQGTDHPRATGQQMARHEAQDLAEVWLLRGSAQFGGAEDMAGQVGRGIPLGTPVQNVLGNLEMMGLLWPQLQRVQIAAFQNSL